MTKQVDIVCQRGTRKNMIHLPGTDSKSVPREHIAFLTFKQIVKL